MAFEGQGKNQTREALLTKGAIKRATSKVPGARYAVVESYDVEAQRVDVLFKDSPNHAKVSNVPIMNGSMEYSIIRPLKKGHVGLMVPLQTDSRGQLGNKDVRAPESRIKNAGISWVFFPDSPALLSQAKPDNLSASAGPGDLDDCGPDDMMIRAGADGPFVLFKSGKELVIKGLKLYMGDLGTNASSYKAAARTGDAVSGGASISGGSTNVFIGD